MEVPGRELLRLTGKRDPRRQGKRLHLRPEHGPGDGKGRKVQQFQKGRVLIHQVPQKYVFPALALRLPRR